MGFEPGTVIDDKYELLWRLGSGSVATVWEAEQLTVGKHVALKLLHPELAQDASLRSCFVEAARAAARIAHANVVDIYDLGLSAEGECYLAMELLRGQPLSEVIEAQGSLGPAYACELAQQMLAGLQAAHQHGIIHCDLKPAHVFITHLGPDRPHVKVVDFAVGRLLFAAPLRAGGLTTAHGPYVAPEQARGGDVGERADLYSAAAILYEMLTGVPPSRDHGPNAPVSTLAPRDLQPVPGANAEMPEDLARIVEAALSSDPSQRPRHAQRFAADLRPFVCQGYGVSLPAFERQSPASAPSAGMPTRCAQLPQALILQEPTPAALSRDFPSLALSNLGAAASAGGVTDSLLCSPRIPKAPTPPQFVRLDRATTEPAGIGGSGIPSTTGSAAALTRVRLVRDVRAAALATAAGFGIGMAVAWLAGVL